MKVLLLGEDVEFYEETLKHLNVSYELGLDLDPNNFDRLLIPGGIDVDPYFYNEENTESQKTNRDYDQKQLAIIDYFVKNKKPILGICRGHQLLNVYFGGNLIQDLKTKRIHYQEELYVDKIHDIEVCGWLKEVYKKEKIGVNSSHHQAISNLGEGLEIQGIDDEGVIEAIRHKSLPIIGVQFHPERMCLKFESDNFENGLEIFKYFLKLK